MLRRQGRPLLRNVIMQQQPMNSIDQEHPVTATPPIQTQTVNSNSVLEPIIDGRPPTMESQTDSSNKDTIMNVLFEQGEPVDRLRARTRAGILCPEVEEILPDMLEADSSTSSSMPTGPTASKPPIRPPLTAVGLGLRIEGSDGIRRFVSTPLARQISSSSHTKSGLSSSSASYIPKESRLDMRKAPPLLGESDNGSAYGSAYDSAFIINPDKLDISKLSTSAAPSSSRL